MATLSKVSNLQTSIKKKISIHVTVMIVVIVTILSVVAYTEFKEAMIRSLDDQLRSYVGSVNTQLGSDASETEIRGNINSILNNMLDKHIAGYGVWIGDQNDFIARSESFQEMFEAINSKAASDTNSDVRNINFYNINSNGKHYRAIQANFTKKLKMFHGDRDINIVVIINSHNTWHEIGELIRVLLLTSIIAVSITVVLIFFILKSGMKPIHSITDQMADTSGSNLFELKFNESESPVELKPFIVAWNQLIAKLANLMSRQKQFTADASHELRTPLAVIKSTLQISRFKKRSPEFYESAIDKCLNEMARMENLINQLLELAECDENALNKNWHIVNLKDLISLASDRFIEPARQKNQNIKLDYLFDLSVNCRPDYLTRAFSNLIGNAVKYGPANSDININMKINGSNVTISFQDAGGNIPAQECESIFDRFYKADKARNHKSGGAGLGLAITREIIERHNGSISVMSNPDSGTVFTITLPA